MLDFFHYCPLKISFSLQRTKKSLGPEFVTFESSEDPGVCDYCLLPANKLRSKGTGREVLLKCKDCKARGNVDVFAGLMINVII